MKDSLFNPTIKIGWLVGDNDKKCSYYLFFGPKLSKGILRKGQKKSAFNFDPKGVKKDVSHFPGYNRVKV